MKESSRQRRLLSATSDVSGSMDVALPLLSWVRITASDRGLTGLGIVPKGELPKEAFMSGDMSDDMRGDMSDNPARALLEEAARQLVEWFAHRRMTFDLPLDVRGTAFQRSVWDALARIPYGTTRTYGELACDLGRPGAARAVGQAAAANPLPVVLPCHRLVAKSGLGGFSLGKERRGEPAECVGRDDSDGRDGRDDSDGSNGCGGNTSCALLCSLGLKKRLLEFERELER